MDNEQDTQLKKRNRKIGLVLCGVIAFFAIMPWVSAPLYRKFCGLLGIGTAGDVTVSPVEVLRKVAQEGIGKDRAADDVSLVNFMGVSGQLPIDIVPLKRREWVKTGDVISVVYRVTNLSDKDLDYRAVHMVLPSNDTAFQLIKCFCEEHRVIKAKTSEDLPLVFMLTKSVPGDAGLTVNYTVFKYEVPEAGTKASSQVSSS